MKAIKKQCRTADPARLLDVAQLPRVEKMLIIIALNYCHHI